MFGIHFMPVWAYTLAAHIHTSNDFSLSLLDLRFEKLNDAAKADAFFFTGINQDFDAIIEAHTELKDRFPNALFLIGGPICWSYNTAGRLSHLDIFDHIIIGDGEDTVQSLVRDLKNKKALPKLIQTKERFDLSKALPMYRALLDTSIHRYYGGVIEVSRGCPFLCEFCDIRILPDNNRSHVKNADLIVDEVNHMADLGVAQILFACDNFIGNPGWAEEVCDKLIEWRTRTGKRVSLYTWLTINVSRTPRLLKKLRDAGFDMFFIGVESFNQSSLLETAKVQNTTLSLVEALRDIQAYGFIVVAGLIFGFDTDPDNIVDITLDGIIKSGLISGDPSLLTALPGTPLYKRMQLTGRLRNAKLGLGGFKYQTNIKYLRPADMIRADFKKFVHEFNTGEYQYKRLRSFYSCLDSNHYVSPKSDGYADLARLMSIAVKNLTSIHLLFLRIAKLFGSFDRARFIARAFVYTLKHSTPEKPLWFYFKFWLFNWSNSVLKYGKLSDKDFNIESIDHTAQLGDMLPTDYENESFEETPSSKVRSQRKLTSDTLKKHMAKKVN